MPLGFFLSGGIDSGLIVALASELSGSKLSTYTVSFEGSEFDESSSANLVAKKFNTNHQTLRAEIDLERDILFLVNQYDEPFGDSSAIPTMAVCREASNDLGWHFPEMGRMKYLEDIGERWPQGWLCL